MSKYDHQKIEKKWQQKWQEEGLYKTEDKVRGKENYYTLVEFAYPSGNLHVGHWYAFSVTDMYARYMRMQGSNVLFPFGFDSFGLPAENAAIKRNLNPRDWTYQNIEYMRGQLDTMGNMFDWSREVITSDPSYYKWTQWLFLQLFKKGLAYRAETLVNWCPSCKTVLANEQVNTGLCERCESEVEKRQMKQWMFKITDYADRLLNDLDDLDWPEPIKEAQRQWIGKSDGAELEFEVNGTSEKIKVFTTRPDTLFGATYMVLAPEHSLLETLKDKIENWSEVEKYIKQAGRKTELERQENKDKTGIELKGVKAINPGSSKEIPIWISDYVLATVGTGAIMAVPAHDERDHEFATKFGLPIVEVVSAEGVLKNSGKFDGLSSKEAHKKITKVVGGKMKTQYRLRDWGVSRQRYWGCPIPIIHCEKCGEVAVKESDLPVELPEIEDYMPSGDGKSPLAKVNDFVNAACPKCGGEAQRETDTLDTFVDSSWYFLRYTDPKNEEAFADKKKMKKWMPVDFYSGGAEHTTMHLLYSRFFQKALSDLRLVKNDEPYSVRMNRGIILGPDGNKMSKSKGNVIDPDDVVSDLGADTVRMYLAFIGPYNEVGHYPWDPKSIGGVRRFLDRVWRLTNNLQQETNGKTEVELHKTVKKVGEEIQSIKMNTAVAALMSFLNVAEKEGVTQGQFEIFLRLLAPLAPHMSEELWREVLGHDTSIHLEGWPEYDQSKLEGESVTIAVQVDGKMRTQIEVAPGASEGDVVGQARRAAEKWLSGKVVAKEIYVSGRLVNFVLD